MRSTKAQKAWKRKDYLANRDRYLARFRVNNRKRKQIMKSWFREQTKDMKCEICGESERICLDFHHVDPTKKKYEMSQLLWNTTDKDKILNELSKCVVLCSNCHRKFHSGIISL